MPPFLPKKRVRSESPEASSSKQESPGNGKPRISTGRRKTTLFDDIDAGVGPKRTASQSKALLKKLVENGDDSSSLSSLSDTEDEFEDVPLPKRQKIDSDDEDDDVEFEDVDMAGPISGTPAPPDGDLELTLTKDSRVSLTNPFGTKKGPTKNERMIRTSTHQIHVQLLMWHNAIRNAWCCNKEVQEILVKQCPATVLEQVERWRRASGIAMPEEKTTIPSKGKGKGKKATKSQEGARKRGDWGGSAQQIAHEGVDMSGGDPIFRLLKVLNVYWKSRFRIVAPGLRKLGYMSLQRLDEEVKSFHNEDHDLERHGERIADIEAFKTCARMMEGSRDVGGQLYTAFLRGLGLEARLVASLQPLGFGWSQVEEAEEKNPRKLKKTRKSDQNSSDEEQEDVDVIHQSKKPRKAPVKSTPLRPPLNSKPGRHSARGDKHAPIDLENSEEQTSDDVVDVTPIRQKILPSLPYDLGLQPIYWTECLSPITSIFTPVEAVVLNIIGTGPDQIERFEVRTSKQEKLKQVTAYIIGHSSDGTAKDVTTRYLKKQIWPGKTRGFRIGIEKIPIYNRHGKVKRYEQQDWFRSVMSGYVRGTRTCPRTEFDDVEDTTSLKPNKPEKIKPEDMKESLQYYKSSKEFVLERFLKREEALLPNAKHVKMFTVKGTKGQPSTDEKVYLRKDVVSCKSTETWHKEGRAPIPFEEPRKRVPYRVATTTRRRELAEAEHATGEKMLQGLFSVDQTDWIIPEPIQNGIIPKNSYGNIDLFVESMLPAGAVHIPYRGIAKICKRIEVDFAEAVTGFEFGNKMAVPVITGVVVAEEYFDTIMEEWEKDEAERVRKEDEKRQQAIIKMWRKMLMGMRVVKRVREDYGGDDPDAVDAINPFSRKTADQNSNKAHEEMQRREEDMAGGFFQPGHDEEEAVHDTSYFPVASQGGVDDTSGGGFMVEEHDDQVEASDNFAYVTSNHPDPMLQSGPLSVSEAEDSEVEVLPMTKKWGRPSVSKSKFAAKAPKKGGKPTKKSSSRQVKKIDSLDDHEEVEDSDELLSLPSDSESEAYAAIPNKRNASRKQKSVQANSLAAATRQTPRRAAKRKQTELTSPYFAHQNENGDDVDGEST